MPEISHRTIGTISDITLTTIPVSSIVKFDQRYKLAGCRHPDVIILRRKGLARNTRRASL